MFINTLVQTLFKLVALAAAAFVGILAGKKLRDKKTAGSEKDA